MSLSRRAEFFVAACVLALGVVLLGLGAPYQGEFWWSDAPRHALNGVFVKDFVAAMPWHDPVGYATRYYLQYPALTILFYPPLFYAISAPFYAVFGVSHLTALVVVLLHDFAFALGLYALTRRYCGAGIAIAVGLAGLAAPGIALWARQIMLELPSLAFVVWGLYFLRRAGDEKRPWLLYLGAFLLLCAVYTKFTAIVLAPVAALMLFAAEGRALWRSRHNWTVAALFAVGLVPVLILTWKFGQANVQSVTGIADAQVQRNSLAAYGWYAMQLPDQLWWPLLVAAALWPVTLVVGLRNKLVERADLVLMFGWFVLGYVFFSLIDLKEARHSTLILPPLLIAAGLAMDRLMPWRLGGIAALCVVALTAAFTWAGAPVPEVGGYAQAAQWIAKTVPKDSIVLFSGKRDGSFVFNLRAQPGRGDIATIRSDKLLLDVAVRRELGVKERDLDEKQIASMLDKSGVSYVVAQSDFWTDLAAMARLQNVLRSDQFEEVKRVVIMANVPTEDTELRIYKNRHPVESNAALSINLPIIGRSIEGQVGSQRE